MRFAQKEATAAASTKSGSGTSTAHDKAKRRPAKMKRGRMSTKDASKALESREC